MPLNLRTHRGSARPTARWIDPEALMQIRSLELRARTVVEGFLSGLHRSPYHGFSAEFSEYRGYSPGDDLRRLDWKVVARTDRYFVKRYEEETNLRCHFLVDLSGSMNYGQGPVTKAAYAKTATATLASFLSRQRDAVGLLTFSTGVNDALPARYRPGHLHRIIQCLEHATVGDDTDLSAPLEQVTRVIKQRGVVVLISDLLTPLEGLDERFGALRCRGHEVIVFRVLDRSERELSLQNPSMIFDLETGRQIYVDPSHARDSYQETFEAHQTALRTLCSERGIDLIDWTTDQPLEHVLFDFLHARQRRGHTVLRRSRSGGTS